MEANEIKGLKYGVNEKLDFVYEYFFRGFDIWDVLPGYRDRFHWYTLNLIKNDGGEIPIYMAGQYQPREPIMLFVRFEHWLLDIFGLYNEVSAYSKNMLENIIRDFKSSGMPHKLC